MKLLLTLHALSTTQSFIEGTEDEYTLVGEVLGVPIRIENVPPQLLVNLDKVILSSQTESDDRSDSRIDDRVDYSLGNIDYGLGSSDD
jgi:hypothetical protein